MMPSKKKKYNARFPAGRIKKIMQTDDDVGKVAQAVPVIISRALELFVESLLTKAVQVTNARNAKTLTPSHMRQCILSESRFDFLRDLVSNISEVVCDDEPTHPPAAITSYFPPVKKTESTRGRGRGGSRSASRSSSTSLNGSATALRQRGSVSSQPATPTTPITPGCPSFYKEIPFGEESKECQDVLMSRPPVIQHTGPSSNRPLLDDSGEEEEDDSANGYGELTNHNTRPLMIDDDYDT